jgi:WD40 repeat protein
MQPAGIKYDLFVLYAPADRAWVEGYLFDALRAAQLRVHSETAFELGQPRLAEFDSAIKQSARTLLVLSPAYVADHLNNFVELLAAHYSLETNTWPVIPLILRPVALPTRLAMLVPLDATDPADWSSVIERLCSSLGAPIAAPATVPDCPYPGMEPFGEADSRFFFGRDEEIEEVTQRLRLHPLLVIIGPSGSGKSSLVFAGVLPALRASHHFGGGEWRVKTMRPGANPLATLDSLLDGAQQHAERTLLVIDQLEEMFTLANQEESEAFQATLLERSAAPNLYMLLTVRIDFYNDLQNTALWPRMQAHRLVVRPLDDRGLRQAIVRPAEQVGVYVEAALVERLVADAAFEPGMLPLVQETLVLLWDRVERRFLPLSAYEALVLPRRAYSELEHGMLQRTGLQVAMARRADAAYNEIVLPEQQAIIRRIFLRLIQFGEGRADTRRQQPETELQAATDTPAHFRATLEHLVTRRLLTVNQDERNQVRLVDLAHEALIGGWPLLRGWLAQWRTAERARRRLELKSQEWQRLGEAEGGLLDPVELAEAQRWLASPAATELGISPTLLALVECSRAALNAVEQAQRAARQRELEQERRRVRLLRWVVGLIALLLVVATTSAYLIGRQSKDNRDTRNVIAAQLLRDRDNLLPVSLLLAAESIQSSAAEQASELLRYGLALLPPLQFAFLHEKPVIDVAFSPDSRWVASVGEDGEVQVREAAGGRPLPTLAHRLPVYTATFSPDGQLVATGGADQTAHVWEIATGREMIPPLPYDADVLAVVFSPDGQKLAVAGSAHHALVWDYRQGTLLLAAAHDSKVNGVTFSPDGRWLATAGDDGTAKVWDIATAALLRQVAHAGQVFQVVFSPNGQHFATASSDSTACVWDATTGNQIDCVNHNDWVEDLAYSPDGQLLATASDDGTVRLWDTDSFRERLRMFHDHAVNRVAFHPQGWWLVTASQDKTARVWDAAAGAELARLIHEDVVENAVFSPDGRWVATASADLSARIWHVDLTAEVARFQLGGYVWGAAFSPDGQQLATATDGTVLATIWQIADQHAIDTFPKNSANVGIAAVFSHDLRYLAMPSRDDTIRVWDLQDKRELARFSRVTSGLAGPDSLALSGDGRWLASGDDMGILHLWEVATQQEILQAPIAAPIRAVEFSDSGELLAIATDAGSLYLYSQRTDWAMMQLPEVNPVVAMAFDRDEKQLATFSRDGYVRVWDSDTGAETTPEIGPLDGVRSLAFSPYGRWLATGGEDRIARIWELATGQEVTRLLHRNAIQGVVFSQDGRWLATASGAVAKVWDFEKLEKVGAQELVSKVCSRLTRNLNQDEWETFFGNESYRQTCSNLPNLSGRWQAQ